MTATELADLLERRLTSKSEQIQTWTEWRTQLEVTDALLDAGHKAFMEYPYPETRDACDIAVTRCDDCEDVTDWIELKPVLPGYFYWGPAKFIVEARFKHDIRKLAALTTGHRWFLMVMVTHTAFAGLDVASNPTKGKQPRPGTGRRRYLLLGAEPTRRRPELCGGSGMVPPLPMERLRLLR